MAKMTREEIMRAAEATRAQLQAKKQPVASATSTMQKEPTREELLATLQQEPTRDDLLAALQEPVEKKDGFLKKAGTALARTISQPAEFFQRLGTSIGKAGGEFVGEKLKGKVSESAGAFARDVQEGMTKEAGGLMPGTTPFKSVREGVGSGLEAAANIAGLVVPAGKAGSLVTQGSKAISTFGKAVVPRAIETGALGLAGETGRQLQEGDGKLDAKKLATTTAISAAIPFAGTIAGQTVRKATDVIGEIKSPATAARIVNSLVKPLKKDFAYGKNPGRAIAQEGIVADDMEDLATKIVQKRQSVGQKISETSKKYETIPVDNTKIFSAIDKAIETAQKAPRTNASLIERLQTVKKDLLGIKADEMGNEIVTRDLANMKVPDAIEFKRLIGDLTKWTGNASDDAVVNKTLKQTYGLTKENIYNAVKDPKFKELNERYADLLSAESAVNYRAIAEQKLNLVGLAARLATYGGAVMSSLSSGSVSPLLLGLGSAGIDAVLSSPKVKTQVARWLAKASPAKKAEILSKAPVLKNAIDRVFGGQGN